jgi:hypothetical protein
MPKRKISQVCECAELKRHLAELSARHARICDGQVQEINKLKQEVEVMKVNTMSIAQAHTVLNKLKDESIHLLRSQLDNKNIEIEQLKSVKNFAPVVELRRGFLNKFDAQPHQGASEPEAQSVVCGDVNLSISRLLVDRRDYAKFVIIFDAIEGLGVVI